MKLISGNIISAMSRLNRESKLKYIKELFIKEMNSKRMDSLLELLLDAMSIFFVLNPDFRRNIDNFRAKYTFRIGNNGSGASVVFSPLERIKYGRMIVKTDPIDDADVSVTFESGRAMAEFLFSESPDIFAALLDNKLSFSGNLNYLFKFAYMAKHLPKTLGIEIPAAA